MYVERGSMCREIEIERMSVCREIKSVYVER